MNPSPGPWEWDVEDHSRNVLRASNGVSVALLDVRLTPEGRAAEMDDRTVLRLVPEMRDWLLKLEWQFVDRAGVGACPVCQQPEDVGYGGGHEAGCNLATFLERIR